MAVKYKHKIEPAGDFSVIDNKHTKGGFFSVKTLTQLYQIKQEFRILSATEGTMVYVEEDKNLYRLINEPLTPFTTNVDWEIALNLNAVQTPLGTWNANNLTPVLQDTDAVGKNNSYYFVTGSPNSQQVSFAGLFNGETVFVKDGYWIYSNGSRWLIVPLSLTAVIDGQVVIDEFTGGTGKILQAYMPAGIAYQVDIQGDQPSFANTSGTNTALTASFTPTILSVLEGSQLRLRLHTNIGAGATLDVGDGNILPLVKSIDNITSVPVAADDFKINQTMNVVKNNVNGADVYEIIGSTNSFDSLTVSNDLTINGNLIVNGDQVIQNVSTIEVEDNTILLNRNESGSSVTAGSAGIEIERGTGTNYEILFDEATGKTQVGFTGSLENVATEPWVTAAINALDLDPNIALNQIAYGTGTGITSSSNFTYTNASNNSVLTVSAVNVTDAKSVVKVISGLGNVGLEIESGNETTDLNPGARLLFKNSINNNNVGTNTYRTSYDSNTKFMNIWEFETNTGDAIQTRGLWQIQNGGNSPNNLLEFANDGQLRLNTYGAGSTHTGTATYMLAVDANGNVIEKALPTSLANIADDAGNSLLLGNTGTAGNVTLTAQGLDANVDITLTPKGSGTVNVSNAFSFNDSNVLTATDDILNIDNGLLFELLASSTNSSVNTNEVAGIEMLFDGTTSGARGGKIRFNTAADGSTTYFTRMTINGDGGVTIGNPTGGSQGSGTLNAFELYVNGVAVGTSETTINNNADNRIITGSSTANTLNAEANFTYNDATGEVDILGTGTQLQLSYDGNNRIDFTVNSAGQLVVAGASQGGNPGAVELSYLVVDNLTIDANTIVSNSSTMIIDAGGIQTFRGNGAYNFADAADTNKLQIFADNSPDEVRINAPEESTRIVIGPNVTGAIGLDARVIIDDSGVTGGTHANLFVVNGTTQMRDGLTFLYSNVEKIRLTGANTGTDDAEIGRITWENTFTNGTTEDRLGYLSMYNRGGSSGTNGGNFKFFVRNPAADTFVDAMQISHDGVVLDGATNGFQGNGTINATGLYVNGVPVTNTYIDINSTGAAALANGTDAIAIGQSTTAGGQDSVSIGHQAASEAEGNISIGYQAGETNGVVSSRAINIGYQTGYSVTSVNIGNDSIAIGYAAKTLTTNAIAIGASSNVNSVGIGSIAIGAGANSIDNSTVSIGVNSYTNGVGSISIGANAGGASTVISDTAINIGLDAGSTSQSGVGAIAIGAKVNASGDKSIVMGYHTVAQTNSIAESFRLMWGGVTAFHIQKSDVEAAITDETYMYTNFYVDNKTTGNYTALAINVIDNAAGGTANKLIDLQVGSVSQFSVDDAGNLTGTDATFAGALTVDDALTTLRRASNIPLTLDRTTTTGLIFELQSDGVAKGKHRVNDTEYKVQSATGISLVLGTGTGEHLTINPSGKATFFGDPTIEKLTGGEVPVLTFKTPEQAIVDGTELGKISWSVHDNSTGRVQEEGAYIKFKGMGTWTGSGSTSAISFGIRSSNTVFLDDVFTIAQDGGVTVGIITGGQLNVDNLRLDGNTLSSTDTNGNLIIDLNGTGIVDLRADMVPETDNTYDLGTISLRYANVYTNDLHLKNKHGDYTIVEGEEDLFLYNNKTDKVYKFALQEVDPSEAPEKNKKNML